MAILTPTVTSVRAVAKSAICRNNLLKLCTGFSQSAGGRTLNTGGNLGVGTRQATYPFPESLLWPGVPKDIRSVRSRWC